MSGRELTLAADSLSARTGVSEGELALIVDPSDNLALWWVELFRKVLLHNVITRLTPIMRETVPQICTTR